MQKHFKSDAVQKVVEELRPILELANPDEGPTIPGSDAYVPSYVSSGAEERRGNGELHADSQGD